MGGMVDNTLGTNMFGENANEQGLQSQTAATQRAIAEQTPWAARGQGAFNALADGKFMDNYQAGPGYQFQLAEGQKAINNGAAARGMGNSGATLKALAGYSQGLANQTFNQDRDFEFNRLNALAGYGSNATNAISNAHLGLGNASAAAAMGRANQFQNTLSSGLSLLGASKNKEGAAGAGMLFSDKRLKKNLKPISKEDREEMTKILKAYHFNYLSDEHGSGDWIGVMAQDLEKSKIGKTLVVENSEGLKTIDQNKVLSMFLAYMAEAA